ncbi:MAG: hypothetical protein JWP74_3678, partial [Marmoricola sp.]|nr:hypothetical protein [Marmoricola sp.]
MRKTATILLASAALVIGTAPLAGATKPAYKVTLRTNVASSTA